MLKSARFFGLTIVFTLALTLVLLPARAQREISLPSPTESGTQEKPITKRMERKEQLRDEVSATHGIPRERLVTGDLVTQRHPLTGVETYQAKFVDEETGGIYSATLDAEGKAVDAAEVSKREGEKVLATYGKIDPRLFEKMAAVEQDRVSKDNGYELSTTGSKSLPVSIWLNVPDPPLMRQISAANPVIAQTALSTHLTGLEFDMQAKKQDALKVIRRMDANVRDSRYSPAIFANLTPAQIRVLAKRSDVAQLYSGAESYTLYNDDSSTTLRLQPVWVSGNFGNLGAGMVRPVVHEPDGIADFNPFLNNASHSVIFWCTPGEIGCPLGKNNVGSATDQQHATWVAGVIGSTHPLVRGIAPLSQVLLSANSQDFTDAKLVDAFEWARNNGGDPTNMSWGSTCGGGAQNFMSRYLDWATRFMFATFVVSSGNTRGCSTSSDPNADLYVGAPGVAWSVITVGSHTDNNNGFWSGDAMSAFSRFVNPTFAPGMEKPEVVAVGQDVRTADNQGGDHLSAVGVNGTSFSAPQVAAQVALLLSRKPGQNVWPETNKAAVMTSAFHDITAGTSRDGVGSVVISQSDDTYRLNRFRNDCGTNCFPLAASDFPRNYLVSLTAGQRVRAAIAWDSISTGGGGSDVLGADIDLQIIRPGGVVIASSVSVQNAWELVDFVAPVTGTYTFRASLFSSMAGWPGSFMGMAYSIQAVPNFCTGVSTGVGTIAVNTINGPTWFDTYAGWSFNQSGREYIRRLDLTTVKDINISDTNPSIDLHLIRIPSCTADPIVPTVVANGISSIFVDNAPAGTYYVVADGFNGTVGTTTLTISLTGP